MVPGDSPIVLVVDSPKAAEEARLELARIGFDSVTGYAFAEELEKPQQLSQRSACDLKRAVAEGASPYILDVRTPGEWSRDHIDGAHHIPLPQLPRRLDEVPRSAPVATVCASGYRSSIAASLLQKNGVSQVENVMGGMGAYIEAPCPKWHPADLVFPGEGI